MEEIECCLGIAMSFRHPGRMNIFSSPSEVIPLTNIFRNQPQNPNHVTLKLSLSHVTFICPSCISITNCDLTKNSSCLSTCIRARLAPAGASRPMEGPPPALLPPLPLSMKRGRSKSKRHHAVYSLFWVFVSLHRSTHGQ